MIRSIFYAGSRPQWMVAWYRVWHPLYYPFGWRVAMCGCGTTIPLVGGGIPLWLEGTYVWAWYYYPFGWWVCGWGDSYRPLRLEGVCGVWYPLAGGFVRVGNAPLVGGGIPL